MPYSFLTEGAQKGLASCPKTPNHLKEGLQTKAGGSYSHIRTRDQESLRFAKCSPRHLVLLAIFTQKPIFQYPALNEALNPTNEHFIGRPADSVPSAEDIALVLPQQWAAGGVWAEVKHDETEVSVLEMLTWSWSKEWVLEETPKQPFSEQERALPLGAKWIIGTSLFDTTTWNPTGFSWMGAGQSHTKENHPVSHWTFKGPTGHSGRRKICL